MKVAVLTPQGVWVREERRPAPGPGQALVRASGCGVCDGDLYAWRNRAGLDEAKPVWIGHEGSGTVAEVGEGVEGWKPGDPVTTLAGAACAEYFVSPAAHMARLPEGMRPASALGEPLACCVAAMGRLAIRLGDRVAVIGAGFMGLVCLQLARLRGAAECVVFEPIPWRRDKALALGADAAHDPGGQEPADAARAWGEFDTVLEATGQQGALDLATALVRHHGVVGVVGTHHSGDGIRRVPMYQWNWKAIDVVNGHIRDLDAKMEAMRAALRLVARGRLDLGGLVADYPLQEAARAFEDMASRKPGLFKANIVF